MSIFAIGDLHLSLDERINKPMDIFGDRWENHHLRVERSWLKNIKEEDTVIICGDISWGLRLDEAMEDLRWISRLPGYKIITKGNHDLWWTSTNRLNTLFDNIYFLQNKAIFLEKEDVYICGTRGWITPGTRDFDAHDEKIYNREVLRLKMSLDDAVNQEKERTGNKPRIISAIHYPPTNDKAQGSGFTDLMAKYGVSTCVFGHLHGEKEHKQAISGVLGGVKYRLVALDYVEAQPVKIF